MDYAQVRADAEHPHLWEGMELFMPIRFGGSGLVAKNIIGHWQDDAGTNARTAQQSSLQQVGSGPAPEWDGDHIKFRPTSAGNTGKIQTGIAQYWQKPEASVFFELRLQDHVPPSAFTGLARFAWAPDQEHYPWTNGVIFTGILRRVRVSIPAANQVVTDRTQWHSFALSNKEGGEYKCFQNGTKIFTASGTQTSLSSTLDGEFGTGSSSSYVFNGDLRALYFWIRELTETEQALLGDDPQAPFRLKPTWFPLFVEAAPPSNIVEADCTTNSSLEASAKMLAESFATVSTSSSLEAQATTTEFIDAECTTTSQLQSTGDIASLSRAFITTQNFLQSAGDIASLSSADATTASTLESHGKLHAESFATNTTLSQLEAFANLEQLVTADAMTTSQLQASGTLWGVITDATASTQSALESSGDIASLAFTNAATNSSLGTIPASLRILVVADATTNSSLEAQAQSDVQIVSATADTLSSLESSGQAVIESLLSVATSSVLQASVRVFREPGIAYDSLTIRPQISYDSLSLRPQISWDTLSLTP